MYELGKRGEIFGADRLQNMRTGTDIPVDHRGKPTAMPSLKDTEFVIAGYDQGLGERIIVCESLEDMQELHSAYALGGALNLRWYKGEDPGFVTLIPPSEDKQ
ncbi:hypothetical protein A2714_05135 [Candidatus Woesebacteria bacterium RIFCSPHIGHO2_01_FULL_38_9]|uniref:Uncharacterized protein n=2 Tax=Candidatus Woeseibacteriota TaxID=1752722 RepID=A0A1F7Y2M3_9BACT|nr:MAG: hypothetical protein A2714_05135 [Candidatus Woesebacteria bacterium RIFCSPHIGHO2_01_FULL_38_9]OGM59040.1 MAG: hypothetical protein A3A75_05210 [Candidatus Woesebacteria bacterium RIFCSPLOWO2_01_FULL_39_10]